MDVLERYLRSYLVSALILWLAIRWLRSLRDQDVNLAYRQGRHDAIREWLTADVRGDGQGDDESEG